MRSNKALLTLIPSRMVLGLILALFTSCSTVKVYKRYGVQACLLDNETKLVHKKVTVITDEESFLLSTDGKGCLYLAPKSKYRITHMGAASISSLVEQSIEIIIEGYRPVKFNFHRHLPERTSMIGNKNITEIDGVIDLGQVNLELNNKK